MLLRIIWCLVGGLVLAAVALPTTTRAQEQAGVTAAVRGRVEVALRAGAVGRQVASGEPIFLGNAVTSGADSGMQIVLLDETTFTIGPNSQLTIDEFVYDPQRSAGKVTASVAKGVFRFVTGKVARENPEAMQIRLPTGVIGIRGTIAIGKVDQVEQNGQMVNRQQVILVGPGYDTDTSRRGGIDLIFNGQRLTIWRPGFGSTLTGTGQWGPIEQFPPALVQQVLRELQTRGDQVGSPNTTNIQNGGDSLFDGRRIVTWVNGTQKVIEAADLLNNLASQPDRLELSSFLPPLVVAPPAPPDMPSTPPSISPFFYNQTGVAALDAGSMQIGTYSLFLNVDFGARTVGGGDSRITLDTPVAGGTTSLGQISFGNGTFSYTGLTGLIGTGCGSLTQSCTVNLSASQVTQNGVPGAQLLHALTVLDENSLTLVGGLGQADRTPGFTTNPVPYTEGNSSLEQLRTLSSGQFNFQQTNVPMFDVSSMPTGNAYSIFMNIDFGARTIGGGNSRVELNSATPGPDQTFVPAIPFGTGTGLATFMFNYAFPGFSSGCSPSCTGQLTMTPQNQLGILARSLAHALTIQDSFGFSATGSGVTNGRNSGLLGLPP